MDLIREESLLGNQKVVVGSNSADLVLLNAGNIYIKYGNAYKKLELSQNAVTIPLVDIKPTTLTPGMLFFDKSTRTLKLVDENSSIVEFEPIKDLE